MIEIIGYVGAFLVGFTLGLIGGGGSILSVPILVYLFSVDAVLATAYSLFIVGITSLIGSFSHMKLGNVQWRTALVFGIPSIISVFLTRLFLVPAIPNPILKFGENELSKSSGLLLLFALIMVLASYSMLKKNTKKGPANSGEKKFNYPLILMVGSMEGTITGMVGAGGGFLIIPALVILAKLPMKQAIGTSLVIIATKSLIGFMGDLKGNLAIDWGFLGLYSGLAIAGIVAGSILSKKISGEKLKPAFGWFVLVIGLYIIAKEILA